MRIHPSRPFLRFLAIAAITSVAGLYAIGALPVPDVTGWITDLSNTLGAWTYVFVPALAFLETAAFIGLVVPGETAVVVGGVVAERGEVSLTPLIVLVWVSAVAGDVVSFLLGRRYGPPFLRRHGPRFGLREQHVERIEAMFARHGGRAILLGRFVGVLRAFLPFVAGSSGLALRRMLPYSIAGASVWAAAYTLVGYAFSDSFENAGDTLTRVTLGVVVFGVLILGLRRSGRLGGTRRRPARVTRPV